MNFACSFDISKASILSAVAVALWVFAIVKPNISGAVEVVSPGAEPNEIVLVSDLEYPVGNTLKALNACVSADIIVTFGLDNAFGGSVTRPNFLILSVRVVSPTSAPITKAPFASPLWNFCCALNVFVFVTS